LSVSPPLTYEQTTKVLAKLGDVPIVLIGGQAVYFWADYYQDRLPGLAESHGPFTSKDIDFYGGLEAVQECATRLGGRARLATFEDMNSPNTGTVVFVDEDGHDRQIDFLMAPAGLTAEETLRTSIPATISIDGIQEVTFRVMHPLLSLESRAYNVANLEGYQTPHAKNQLHVAILCARESVCDALDSGKTRVGNRANERIYRIAVWRTGLDVYTRYGIDLFSAVIDRHPALPPLFETVRYTQMKRTIDGRRGHRARVAAMEAARRTAATFKQAQRG
jgi:hypothetical protein